mmetsp:Transcript_135928/g.290499  ORF Transcript_135928/g.290499 Transcript_135928/m.290499 type:complete len:286 (-) Transcript_135928:81-938(-)
MTTETVTQAILEGDGRVWSKGKSGYEIEPLLQWDLIDCAKLAYSPGQKVLIQKLPGVSNNAQAHRDALKLDAYDLWHIHELGLVYYREGRFNECCNVLLRGWKRVPEIPDEDARIYFLLRLGEASFRQCQFRQAAAVLQDVEEATINKDRWLKIKYHMLYARALAHAKEGPKALKAFQVAIDVEDNFKMAIRLWAMIQIDFVKGGCYDAALDAISAKATDDLDKADLDLTKQIVERKKQSDELTGGDSLAGKTKVAFKENQAAVFGIGSAVLLMLFFWLIMKMLL